MARIVLAPGVSDDLSRFLHHLASHDVANARQRVIGIVESLAILAHSPLIGRPFAPGLRELIMGRRPRIYLALYRYVERSDTAVVLALRHQSEQGYRQDFE